MVSIFGKARIYGGNTQVHVQFFFQIKTLVDIESLVLQVKLDLMGCLVKANALVLGNIALSLSSQLIVLAFYETAIC